MVAATAASVVVSSRFCGQWTNRNIHTISITHPSMAGRQAYLEDGLGLVQSAQLQVALSLTQEGLPRTPIQPQSLLAVAEGITGGVHLQEAGGDILVADQLQLSGCGLLL